MPLGYKLLLVLQKFCDTFSAVKCQCESIFSSKSTTGNRPSIMLRYKKYCRSCGSSLHVYKNCKTRRPTSADRTARRHFQATGQPVSQTQASDAMTSRLPCYEVKCAERRCFQCGSVLCVQISRERSYPLPIYWYHSKGNWLRYNIAAESFYIMKFCSRLFVLYCRNCPKDDKFTYFIPILRKLGAA